MFSCYSEFIFKMWVECKILLLLFLSERPTAEPEMSRSLRLSSIFDTIHCFTLHLYLTLCCSSFLLKQVTLMWSRELRVDAIKIARSNERNAKNQQRINNSNQAKMNEWRKKWSEEWKTKTVQDFNVIIVISLQRQPFFLRIVYVSLTERMQRCCLVKCIKSTKN